MLDVVSTRAGKSLPVLSKFGSLDWVINFGIQNQIRFNPSLSAFVLTSTLTTSHAYKRRTQLSKCSELLSFSYPFIMSSIEKHSSEVCTNVPPDLPIETKYTGTTSNETVTPSLLKELSWLDRLLTPLVLLSMIVGVIIGEFVSGVQEAFNTATFADVSLRKSSFLFLRCQATLNAAKPSAIAIGLIVMMWPVLTKVQYETLPKLFKTRNLWYQITLSLFLNWIVGPFIMLAVAWATLPDLPTYRAGVIMVGLARCV